MKLQVPFIQLPLAYDARMLASEVAVLGEEPWRPHPQGFAGNSMLPLVAVDGDPANESFAGEMRPTPALERCPYLMQVFASLGATIGRSRLMRLAGQAEVKRHADQGYYWMERVRVHVPVVTHPTVRFECGDAVVHMAEGECWIFDTWRQHRVLNDAAEARTHLVVDTVGGGRFWGLVSEGRPHDAPRAAWQPQMLAPQAAPTPTFACETMNIPPVMTPWEINAHLDLLLTDALPHPNLVRVRQISMRFARTWQGLWAAFGETPEGRAHFRAALEQFVAEVRMPSQPVYLNNEIRWFNAMLTIIAQGAVADGNASKAMSPEQQREVGDNG